MTEQQVPLADQARLTVPEFYVAEPHATYARLRSEAPVWWCEEGKFWAISKHADITAVAANAQLFSSAYATFTPEARVAAKVNDRVAGGSGRTFNNDPPEHTQYRRMVGGAFTPSAIGAIEPLVQRIVDATLDHIDPGHVVDVVDEIAIPISLEVIAALLGVPQSDWADFKRWTDALTAQLDAIPGSEADRRLRATVAESKAYLLDQLDERRRNPTDDWLSMIATSELNGQPTDPTFQYNYARALLIAGNDTTRNTISAGMATLAEHPDELRRLRRDRSLDRSATAEILRWTSVILAFVRTATAETQIRDQHINEGDFVALLFPAANRDEDAWPSADTFDIGRVGRPAHVAYSWGPHRCLGIHLANLEIRTVLRGLVDRFGHWELTGSIQRRPSTVVDTYTNVPIQFHT